MARTTTRTKAPRTHRGKTRPVATTATDRRHPAVPPPAVAPQAQTNPNLLPPFGGVAESLASARSEIIAARRLFCQLSKHVHRHVMDLTLIEPCLDALVHLEGAEVDVEIASAELEHDTRGSA